MAKIRTSWSFVAKNVKFLEQTLTKLVTKLPKKEQ
jgi:hypothetical protein